MSKGLVIVESPAKAKTIQKYLGKGFTVDASYGHVKDLPKSSLGVDIENDFETEYVVIPGKEKVLAKLKKLAIAAHLADELGEDSSKKKGKKAAKKKTDDVGDEARIRRVTFNEITQRAVKAAFEHPRDIDRNLVDAQQTRRVLDRIVGYQVSPLLWDKVRRGLSAGRVQTVALRLIVDREREIKAFEKKEYWTIDANLAAGKPPAFDARFLGKGEEKIEVTNGEQAEQIRAALEKADWVVRSAEKKERRRNATPPFTTSKLQQDSSRKLRFSVKRTMMIAQRLYEGVELGARHLHPGVLVGHRLAGVLAAAARHLADLVGQHLLEVGELGPGRLGERLLQALVGPEVVDERIDDGGDSILAAEARVERRRGRRGVDLRRIDGDLGHDRLRRRLGRAREHRTHREACQHDGDRQDLGSLRHHSVSHESSYAAGRGRARATCPRRGGI